MAEVDYGDHGHEQNAQFPRWEDAFSIGVRLKSEVSETSVNGKRFDFDAQAGHTHFLYLSAVDYVDFATHRHSIEMVLPRAFMREICEDLEVPVATRLGNDACFLAMDPVLPRLASCMYPYFDDPATLDALYADSFMWCLGIYVMSRYGDLAHKRQMVGGLTTWQERLAKELIETSLSEGLTLADLSGCCGLRVSQFSHAFKRSTGVSPYRWLIQRRISRAKELIQMRRMSLTEIASQLGFADQSHFSRTFVASERMTPSAWLLQHR
jgi:AraC-like DNA-binding protein